MRRVEATYNLLPGTMPTNLTALGIKVDAKRAILPGQEAEITSAKDKQILHQKLLSGTGFYSWMVKIRTTKLEDGLAQLSLSTKTRPIPTLNFLDNGDALLANAIVEEALPQDRDRFRGYLSHRPLALGLIAAGPGTGKTTCIASVTLAMQAKLGPIACTAPTNVATDNFAKRIDARSRAVSERCNSRLISDHKAQYRHLLVVRGYTGGCEQKALLKLLQNPGLGDSAASVGQFKASSRWKLHLSPAYWTLTVLGSPAGEELHQDASAKLWSLRSQVEAHPKWKWLRGIASGTLDCMDTVKKYNISISEISELMAIVVTNADVLCTTPAGFSSDPIYTFWRNEIATGIAVDDAASMHRADLFSVWGNCLLPCFLSGDTKQLPPTVMTTNEALADGNLINRFASAGKISPLLFFMAMGYPVYRLDQQLRMGNGLFDMVSSVIYPEVELTYAAGCSIDQPQFKIGRDLEAFMLARFRGKLSPAPKGKLLPIFVHCKGTTERDASGSLRNPVQVKAALDLVAAFVKQSKADPARIIVIAPHKANVHDIKLQLEKNPDYAALAGMPPATTTDSFQGQENDIAIVVMGITSPTPGPGFTANEQRLNVMLTRQRCGLIVVGDLFVTGRLSSAAPDAKVAGSKAAPREKFKVTDTDGNHQWITQGHLKDVHNTFFRTRRWVRVEEGK